MARKISWELRLKDRASAGFKDVAAAASETTKGADGATESLKSVQEATGETDSILQGLAGALDRVSPGLGNLMRGAGDAAGGMEAMARMGPGLIGVLGGVGVAVAALAGVWEMYSRQLEEALSRQQEMEDQAATVTETYLRFEIATNKLKVATGELAEEDAQLVEARAEAQALLEPRKAQLEAEIERTKELIEVEKSYSHGLLEKAKALTFYGKVLVWAGLLEENSAVTVASLTDELNGYQQQLAQVAMQEDDYTEDKVKANQATSDSINLSKERTASLNAERQAQRELAEAEKERDQFWREFGRQLDEFQTAMETLASMTTQSMRSMMDPAELLLDNYNQQIEAINKISAAHETSAAIAAQSDEAKLAALQEYLSEVDKLKVEAPDEEARFQGPVVGMAAGAATGSVAPMLSAAGPWGAIIAAALAIGEQGADAIGDKLDKLQANVAGFFDALPQLIGEVIPDFIAQTMERGPEILMKSLVPITLAVVGTIIKLPVLIVSGMITGIVNLFENAGTWETMVKQITEAFKNLLTELLPTGNTRDDRVRRSTAYGLMPGLATMSLIASLTQQHDPGA